MTPNDTIDSLLQRGVLEVIDQEHLKKRLQSGEKLRIKLGIDASKPDLHIGHMVPLRKLRAFQEAGHTAILLMGDYTAQLGDPADKSEARKLLSYAETRSNAEAYLDQLFCILDKDKTEIRYNSEWYNKFSMRDAIDLVSSVTLNHLLSHETFQKRLEEGVPLYTHEIIYPIMQGYDSVELKADVELGGADQKFNVLMGRVMQRLHKMPEQDIMLFPYLPGIDGQQKMSKSLGNTINLTDSANDMFGKVMSIPDALIPTYFELATSLDEIELETIKAELEDPSTNPKDIKVRLAKMIVTEYHSSELADEAADMFDKQFRQKQMPDDIEDLVLKSGSFDIIDILVKAGFANSNSEARRLIDQGGVKKSGVAVKSISEIVSPKDGDEIIVQVGSRRFVRVKWKQA